MDETENTCSWYDPSCALSWLSSELQTLALFLYEKILSGLAATAESLPSPDFLNSISSSPVPSGVAWAAQPFQLDIGITIIVSAYTARFLLRRIPGIG